MTSKNIDDVFEKQQQANEAAEETLHIPNFTIENDLVEIGDRLVEFERRQHAVEHKLDRVLEPIEDTF